MNKLEAAYSVLLEAQQRNGKIVDWRFEKIKLGLAKESWYTCDFFVVLPDGLIEFHEVKGHWREAARVRIKVAAELYWCFTFRAVTHDRKTGWKFEEF